MRVRVREWPGAAGPLLHIPDPLATSGLIDQIAALVAPAWRVMSLTPRSDVPYQVQLADVLGVLRQFGFVGAAVVGEGIGCVVAILLAAWHPEHVGRLILAGARCTAEGDSLAARALRDCPPDLEALRAAISCRISTAQDAEEIAATLP